MNFDAISDHGKEIFETLCELLRILNIGNYIVLSGLSREW